MMEIGDRFVKHGAVEIGKTCLELTERLTRRLDHVQILGSIERNGFDIVDDTPEGIVLTNVVVQTFVRVVIMKRSLVGVFFADVTRDAVNIFHDLDGIFENVGIDPLEKIGGQTAVLRHIGRLIGRVDVTHRDDLVGIKLTREIKLFADFV